MIIAQRYHDISCGHRVAGHESKCAFLHGHNYRVHFTCSIPKLDSIGRVLDFSVMKLALCEWLEQHWDHKFLAWREDEAMRALVASTTVSGSMVGATLLDLSIVWVPFNPTAENMAYYLLHTIGPQQLRVYDAAAGVMLREVRIEETRKCSASASL